MTRILDVASVCYSVSFLPLLLTCVPAQLTPAVLLDMAHFNSIPSGCDHGFAEPTKM